MKEKYIKNIEFDKISRKASENCYCPQAATQLIEEQPAITAEHMRVSLAKVDTITSLIIRDGTPRIITVEGVTDITGRAVKGGLLSMSELLKVADCLSNFKSLKSWYGNKSSNETMQSDVLDGVFFALTANDTLLKSITQSILSENEMADTASDNLYDIRKQIRQAEGAVRDKLDKIIRSQTTQKYLQEALVSSRGGRFVVPVKSEFKSEIGGVIHDVSSSGATLFVEPTAVVEFNAKILQLKNADKEEIDKILSRFSTSVAGLEPQFEYSYSTMLDIDVLVAKARLAVSQNASMPEVNDNYSFSIKKARHPLIDKTNVVPVDIEIGAQYDALIITGPNTGGKTVTLKTAGLLLTMAAHGYLIPASVQSKVCLFKDILVDIGDEQSIEQSLSTFSGHIKNIVEILEEANESTLVLLDELGAGTDPAEGASLAVALIETMLQKGTKLMATTHYGELKVFALETKRVQNASCEFDLETLKPTYKIFVGAPGRSNAFLISEKLGINEQIIAKAATHLSEGDKRFDAVLSQLEDLKLQIRDDAVEIERLKFIAENQLKSAQDERNKLISQGETELKNAKYNALKLSKKVEEEAYALLDEMKALQKQENVSASQKAQRARAIARKEAAGITAGLDEDGNETEITPLTSVTIGQTVVVTEMASNAVVKSLPDKNGMVEVQCGIIKTRVLLEGLSKAVAPQPVKTNKYARKYNASNSGGSSKGTRTPAMEINLIGLNADEAVIEAEQFVDNAVMTGMTTVYIIHGRGAGILRNAVRDSLKRNKSVKSYRAGVYGEGEDGVTVVEVK